MKRYIEIYWTPLTEKIQATNILLQEPRPLLTEIARQRTGNPNYIRCPAVVNFCNNCFLIRSPIDINVSIKNKSFITTDRFGQEFFDSQIESKANQTHLDNPFLMATFPRYMFYSHEPVIMELFDPILLHSNVSRNVRVVPGSFDISKWIRPIEFAFEVIDDTQELQFRVDDPLLSIRFKTVNDVPVKLVRVTKTEDVIKLAQSCVSIKNFRPRLPLKKLYELASNYISAWRNGK